MDTAVDSRSGRSSEVGTSTAPQGVGDDPSGIVANGLPRRRYTPRLPQPRGPYRKRAKPSGPQLPQPRGPYKIRDKPSGPQLFQPRGPYRKRPKPSEPQLPQPPRPDRKRAKPSGPRLPQPPGPYRKRAKASRSRGPDKRPRAPRQPKKTRVEERMEDLVEEQMRDIIAEFFGVEDAAFECKQQESEEGSWCDPIPLDTKIETVQAFYQQLHDENTMPIQPCAVCYTQTSPSDLKAVAWRRVLSARLKEELAPILSCSKCFPEDDDARVKCCRSCREAFNRGNLPRSCQVNNMWIGCEHVYPDALKDLSPVEEKLIALSSPYGFITKFDIVPGKGSASYRKHVKGHISVLCNDVESLVSNVLPHPLVRVMQEVRVFWTGSDDLRPADVCKLLTVRPAKVLAALQWLKAHNPLYSHIRIDEQELESWDNDEEGVPRRVIADAKRHYPKLQERAQTGSYVPAIDRGMKEGPQPTIAEILASDDEPPHTEGQTETTNRNGSDNAEAAGVDWFDEDESTQEEDAAEQTFECTTSGLFSVDDGPNIPNVDKLHHIWSGLSQEAGPEGLAGPPPGGHMDVTEQVGSEPYIRVIKGNDFAEPLDADFFPSTFPTLFPFGRGGPRHITEEDGSGATTRNFGLELWTQMMLKRHGGRFAWHPVFSFLVFNILVRAANRRVSMCRMSKKAWSDAHDRFGRLSRDELLAASEELRTNRTLKNPDVKWLLRELSIFGHAHPLSNESRLNMRRKIFSLCIKYGLPAIWFTINPNDLANPVRLKMTAYRGAQGLEAKGLLDQMTKRFRTLHMLTRDPVSAAEFFHREMTAFFEQYVRVGRKGVFGKISQYYGAVETNHRGMLHLHGLMWINGNARLPNLMYDLAKEDAGEFREKVLAYIDDVFTESVDVSEGPDAANTAGSSWKATELDEMLQTSADELAKVFEREASRCAKCFQKHVHGPVCLHNRDIYRDKQKEKEEERKARGKARRKRKEKRRAGLCRFGAPWPIEETTHLKTEPLPVVRIKRNHPMINRYNKAMIVGLRHNIDVSPIITTTKFLAMVYYITNYATKLNTPKYERLAMAGEIMAKSNAIGSDANDTRSFFVKAANKIFTDRELSAVEVQSHLLGHPTDYTNVQQWTYLYVNSLYWAVWRRWPGLRRLAGCEVEDTGEDVRIGWNGRRLNHVEAFMYRGGALRNLCLYDYMTYIDLAKSSNWARGHVFPWEGDDAAQGGWIQEGRTPGEGATVVISGNLDDSGDSNLNGYYCRSIVVQLGLFVPWEEFVQTEPQDLGALWQEFRQDLRPRLKSYTNNVGLLRKSKEDARLNAALWAQVTDDDDALGVDLEAEAEAVDDDFRKVRETADQPQSLESLRQYLGILGKHYKIPSDACPLINVAARLEETATAEDVEEARLPLSPRTAEYFQRTQQKEEGPFSGIETSTNQLKAIQAGLGKCDDVKRREIEGIRPDAATTLNRAGATAQVLAGFGVDEIDEDDFHASANVQQGTMDVQIGQAASYAGQAMLCAKDWTLNRLQKMVVCMVAEFLDTHGRQSGEEEGGPRAPDTNQLLLYVGGEGGTGKSRIIQTIVDLFRRRGEGHRVVVTASSGAAAAKIGGVTVHSALGLGADRGGRKKAAVISEEVKWRWKEETDVLIVDEVSMVGGGTLQSINEALQARRESREPFGGMPIVILTGDFYQFPPVQQKSLLFSYGDLESAAGNRYKADNMLRHDQGSELWKKFTTVILLQEQVRQRDDKEFHQLLQRFRHGEQTRADLDRLNEKVMEPEKIDFARDLTAITPLNRNRWFFTKHGVVTWARARGLHVHMFLNKHRWDVRVGVEEMVRALSEEDSSEMAIPSVFFFARGMPIIVNANLYQGLKIVNGGRYVASDVILEPGQAGYAIADDITLFFGPPAAVVIDVPATLGIEIPNLPAGVMTLKTETRKLDLKNHVRISVSCSRTGVPCTPAFAITDYKSQGHDFNEIVAEIRGRQSLPDGTPKKCDFMTLYVVLSRCTTFEGLSFMSRIRETDFLGNFVSETIKRGVERLEQLHRRTTESFFETHMDWDR